LVRCFIAAYRDERRHPAHGERAPFVGCLNQKLRIRTQEMRLHRHLRTIRENPIGVLIEGFDKAEDIIPPSAIEAYDMVAQFIQNFFHLESRMDSLDQHGCFNGTNRESKLLFGESEHLVPEAGFQMTLEFWNIKIRPRTFTN